MHLRALTTAILLAIAPVMGAQTLSVADARADFDVLRSALEEAHGGLYRHATKGEVDARFDAYRAQITAPMSKRNFSGMIADLLATIRDGHMRLEFDSALTSAFARARLLPLRLAPEGDKLIVMFNDTPTDSTIRPGMELVSINGRSASDLRATILNKITADGFIETGRLFRLGQTFTGNYWYYIDSTSVFTIVTKDATATLRGVTSAERQANPNPVNAIVRATMTQINGPAANISLRDAPLEGVAIVRVRGFQGDRFPMELDSVFALVRARGTKSVILDLRGNGGGVDDYGAKLVSEFLDTPFRYFDRIRLATIRPSFATWKPTTFAELAEKTVRGPNGEWLVTSALHQGITEQRPAPAPFLGKLVVLLDGGTFSTAADVTATLRHHKRATFVGEESAGGYEGNTSGLNAQVTLPHSELRLKIMMYDYWNAVSPAEKGRGTIPDVIVQRKVEDLMRGVDAQMTRALAEATVHGEGRW